MERNILLKELNFKPDLVSRLPSSLTDKYNFYLQMETDETFNTKKSVFDALNKMGFDQIFIEKVDEPNWSSSLPYAQVNKGRGCFWTVHHIPDTSNTVNGEISLVDDLRLHLLEVVDGLKDQELINVIDTEIKKAQVEHPENWKRVVEYHKLLKFKG